MKNKPILLRDVQQAAATYQKAVQNWGDKNQITIRAMIKWYDLKKRYDEQQTFKSRKERKGL